MMKTYHEAEQQVDMTRDKQAGGHGEQQCSAEVNTSLMSD